METAGIGIAKLAYNNPIETRMTQEQDQGRNERHQQRMVRKKDIVDEKIAAAQTEKGLLLIHTGNGK